MGATAVQDSNVLEIRDGQQVERKGPVEVLRERLTELKARIMKDRSVSFAQVAELIDIHDELMNLLQQTNIDKFLTGEIFLSGGVVDNRTDEEKLADGQSVNERLREAAQSMKGNVNGNGNHDGGTGTEVATGAEDDKPQGDNRERAKSGERGSGGNGVIVD